MARYKMNEQKIEDTLRKSRLEKVLKKEDFLSSGSTLLNLACSGTPYGAFTKGRYFWMVGDSSSGKTFVTLTAFAEASINSQFDEYDLVFDNAEDGALMDVGKYFGLKLAERLQPPSLRDGEAVYSRTAEEFYYNLDDRLAAFERGKGRPFIYLLDSMDSLSTRYEGSKFLEKKKAARGGAEAKGDYGDGKAKINSTWIRSVVSRLRDTGSILIILSQTRDAINAGPWEPSQTSAGGRALKFYATWQLWSSVGRRLKKSVNDKDRQIGIISRLTVKKNRLTGKEWTVEVPIYWSTGLDNVGSMLDFLVDEKHWRVKNGVVSVPEFDFVGSRAKLIWHIDEENLLFDLEQIVTEKWKEIEDSCQVERKNKYHNL